MPRITRIKQSPPERIFLQWLDPEADYAESWEVTWCEDAIDKSDPEYIRKDIYSDLLEACQAAYRWLTYNAIDYPGVDEVADRLEAEVLKAHGE